MALLSVKKVTVTASAKDGASVSSVKVTNNGKSVTLSKSGSQYVGSISAVTSGKYTVTVIDSRGLSASLTSNQTFYNYTYPTIAAATFSRTTATGSNGTLTANGRYANMLSNTVTITVTRTGLSTDTITGSKNSGSWNFSKSYSDLTYTSSFTATIKITDSFGQVAQINVVLARSQPVLWIGKTDVRINGDPATNFYRARNRYLGDGVDLNTLKDSGYYIQNTDAGAENGSNYPCKHAGVLNVYWSSSFTFQQYQSHDDDSLYIRRYYGWLDQWSKWQKLMGVDKIYPVGSIYMSVNSTNPGTLFGGTWQRIEGRFLLGASSTYGAGSTGGEASHTLTVNEIPPHNHNTPMNSVDAFNKNSTIVGTTGYGIYQWNPGGTTGGGASHNNMPPYLSVYIWKRTA